MTTKAHSSMGMILSCWSSKVSVVHTLSKYIFNPSSLYREFEEWRHKCIRPNQTDTGTDKHISLGLSKLESVKAASHECSESTDQSAVSLRLDFRNGKTKKTRSMMENDGEDTWLLPVCQTYCTHTYVLAAKNSHCTGMNSRHIISDVNATHTKNTEKACNTQRDTSDHHMCYWREMSFHRLQ